MLTGSLIMFFAVKMGLSCPQLFTELALTAKPRAAYDLKSIGVLAEAACAVEETDSLWVSAYIKTGFQSRMAVTHDGKFLFAAKANKYLKQLKASELSNVSVGAFSLPAGSIKGSLGIKRVEDTMSGDNQIKYLSTAIKSQYFEKCDKEWVKCWSVNDRSSADKDYWKSVETLLAKAALSSWKKKVLGVIPEETSYKEKKKKTSYLLPHGNEDGKIIIGNEKIKIFENQTDINSSTFERAIAIKMLN